MHYVKDVSSYDYAESYKSLYECALRLDERLMAV